jgi:hypothetical protein
LILAICPFSSSKTVLQFSHPNFDLLFAFCIGKKSAEKNKYRKNIGSFYFITVNREIYGKIVAQRKTIIKDAVAIVIVSSFFDENEGNKE